MEQVEVVADASALIYLAKADAFAAAAAAVGVLGIPPVVWKEAVEIGETRGRTDPATTRLALEHGHLRMLDLTPQQEHDAWGLGRKFRIGVGESQAIVLAQPNSNLLMDDDEAMAVAEELGLFVISTIQVPALCVRRGALDVDRALRMLERSGEVMVIPSDLYLEARDLIREAQT